MLETPGEQVLANGTFIIYDFFKKTSLIQHNRCFYSRVEEFFLFDTEIDPVRIPCRLTRD